MLSSTRYKLLLPVVFVLAEVTFLALDRHSKRHPTISSIKESKPGNCNSMQQERLNRVNYICSYSNFTLLEKGNNFSLGLIYAEKYKLAYLSIPKIGSTFLKKLFYVLKFGFRNAHKIFDRMRAEVHAMSGELVARVNSSELDHVITLVTARNPYTRLYSAYIDKVYLPLSLGLGKSIIHENHMMMLSRKVGNSSYTGKHGLQQNMDGLRQQLGCTKDISFQDFLEFALTKPMKGKAMFDHYAPVSVLLSKYICKLKHLLVIKQETFADDIEYVLKLINVEKNVYELFYNHLYKDRAESSIASIVDTTYRQVRMQSDITRRPDCWNMPLVAERLWKTFQIQGYINDISDFPDFKFSEKSYHDPGYLIKIIQNEVQNRPLSHYQMEEQRKRAFQKAYLNVSNYTLGKIRELYATDFEIFGYDAIIQ
ncbi:uncharacterized protein LOC123547735 [Mercenaria mercenaria]|uniref:uncharacterized protein LOC123547735 n=1 Tax=Mercenaria mercenaria TaxID=6596 RepID=UPI00234F4512|nr:uncharacterized protein LOC123547735 [Mercenaria mercenaria]XP_045190928.2 uncharacterized protein LOC123547735 [Mercenaria mercenaria]